jgi:hypothetical protein
MKKGIRLFFKILLWTVIIPRWIIYGCALFGFAMSFFSGMVNTWQSTSTYNIEADLETWGVVLVSGVLFVVSATILRPLMSSLERFKL